MFALTTVQYTKKVKNKPKSVIKVPATTSAQWAKDFEKLLENSYC